MKKNPKESFESDDMKDDVIDSSEEKIKKPKKVTKSPNISEEEEKGDKNSKSKLKPKPVSIEKIKNAKSEEGKKSSKKANLSDDEFEDSLSEEKIQKPSDKNTKENLKKTLKILQETNENLHKKKEKIERENKNYEKELKKYVKDSNKTIDDEIKSYEKKSKQIIALLKKKISDLQTMPEVSKENSFFCPNCKSPNKLQNELFFDCNKCFKMICTQHQKLYGECEFMHQQKKSPSFDDNVFGCPFCGKKYDKPEETFECDGCHKFICSKHKCLYSTCDDRHNGPQNDFPQKNLFYCPYDDCGILADYIIEYGECLNCHKMICSQHQCGFGQCMQRH